MSGVIISGVEPRSPAHKYGIREGWRLLRINGHGIGDVLDYRFYMMEKKLVLDVADLDGIERSFTVKKAEYEELGLLFDTYLMDSERHCKNKCVFCFIDQLPEGLRESLYFKDDDSRLGFLFGNYITLTNLDDGEIKRITDMRISPVNVSVHTMNPALRVSMMKNPRAGEVLKYIKILCDAGIKVNAQLVICPGINDGDELEYSLSELSRLGANLQSCSCVPVGLTKYREGLSELRLPTKEEAANVIETVGRYAAKMHSEYGSRVFYASDEWYLKAKIPMPEHEYYEDYYQLENGVGMTTLLKHDFFEAIETLDSEDEASIPREISLVTGTAAYPLINELSDRLMEKLPCIKATTFKIINHFFGKNITVSGLVCATDIIDRLKGKKLGDELLIPSVMLRHDRDLFLDGISVEGLSKELGVPVRITECDGYGLLDAMMGRN